MELTMEQLRGLSHGALEVCREEDGLIYFYRMTRQQRQLYADREIGFYNRSSTASGVKLVMRTDSPTLTLDVNITRCTKRQFFSLDVYVEDKMVGFIDGYGHDTMFRDYRKTFELGQGVKTVSVYLPWSVFCGIRAVELEDGAFFEPVRREKKILMYGDSITQGFDSLRPSLSYSNRIADWLGAECRNKAVGADVFFPPLVETPEEAFVPDYVTVAYGTNDWSKTAREDFAKNSALFLSRVRAHYPNAKLFVFAPIWRKNWRDEKPFGPFFSVREELKSACEKLSDVVFIDCFEFVPGEERLFQDLSLHPNDEGFDYYFENLRKAMAPYV